MRHRELTDAEILRQLRLAHAHDQREQQRLDAAVQAAHEAERHERRERGRWAMLWSVMLTGWWRPDRGDDDFPRTWETRTEHGTSFWVSDD